MHSRATEPASGHIVLSSLEPVVLSSTATTAAKALRAAAILWLVVTTVGQWMFLFYVVGVFGPRLAARGLAGLADTHLPGGFVAGDTTGNLAVAGHLALAALILGAGPLQLIPRLRQRAPRVHRWLGRAYVLAAVLGSSTGLYMLWTRGTVGGTIGHVALSIDALLIPCLALPTVVFAVRRQIQRHRRWALRLFIATSSVWFYRIGLMAWATLTGGWGIDFPTFTGPFLDLWAFGQYVLPLTILELYLFAEARGDERWRFAAASVLALFSALGALGIAAATAGMWLPRLCPHDKGCTAELTSPAH